MDELFAIRDEVRLEEWGTKADWPVRVWTELHFENADIRIQDSAGTLRAVSADGVHIHFYNLKNTFPKPAAPWPTPKGILEVAAGHVFFEMMGQTPFLRTQGQAYYRQDLSEDEDRMIKAFSFGAETRIELLLPPPEAIEILLRAIDANLDPFVVMCDENPILQPIRPLWDVGGTKFVLLKLDIADLRLLHADRLLVQLEAVRVRPWSPPLPLGFYR